MSPTNVILLACGSFNPITNMHLRIFEVARDYLHRMGQHKVIGGLISPVHDAYGKKDLESSTHRINMLKLALQTSDWIRLSEWECKQETWSRTRQVLQYHQNQINAILHHSKENNYDKINDDDIDWLPNNVINSISGPVQIKLLCGADLLESFGTPGLWHDDDIEAIIGEHGLIVITRSNTNPLEFIYNSDILTKYMSNIVIVTEWIRNEVSSTKIRKALRRSESVKYLLPEKVIDYIHRNCLYGSKATKYYLNPPEFNSNFLTPSPSDVAMESPSPTNCMLICNNALFNNNSNNNKLSIDTVDNVVQKTNLLNTTSVQGVTTTTTRHPGQAVKIIMDDNGEHTILNETTKNYHVNNNKHNNNNNQKEVCNNKNNEKAFINYSKSCTNFTDDTNNKTPNKQKDKMKYSLKECKSCDEKLIKFIFTKHGIEVISDVETIV